MVCVWFVDRGARGTHDVSGHALVFYKPLQTTVLLTYGTSLNVLAGEIFRILVG